MYSKRIISSKVWSCFFAFTEPQSPHDVEIFIEQGSFGFYLWFDKLGHYIEDVTIGSNADKAGLKAGDRVIKVKV